MISRTALTTPFATESGDVLHIVARWHTPLSLVPKLCLGFVRRMRLVWDAYTSNLGERFLELLQITLHSNRLRQTSCRRSENHSMMHEPGERAREPQLAAVQRMDRDSSPVKEGSIDCARALTSRYCSMRTYASLQRNKNSPPHTEHWRAS